MNIFRYLKASKETPRPPTGPLPQTKPVTLDDLELWQKEVTEEEEIIARRKIDPETYRAFDRLIKIPFSVSAQSSPDMTVQVSTKGLKYNIPFPTNSSSNWRDYAIVATLTPIDNCTEVRFLAVLGNYSGKSPFDSGVFTDIGPFQESAIPVVRLASVRVRCMSISISSSDITRHTPRVRLISKIALEALK